jgi:hypothetical protein
MEIISHRGLWYESCQKNTSLAFERSFELGFGIETDVRDLNGELVISHDMPRLYQNLMSLEELLKLYIKNDCKGTLALNVKADGLQDAITRAIVKYDIKNYVLFDMSIPDTLATSNAGLNFLSRVSDLEPQPILLERSRGVWMDEFRDGWFSRELIEKYLNSPYRPYIVSPELHGRDPVKLWNIVKDYCDYDLVLCTDFPTKAQDYLRI